MALLGFAAIIVLYSLVTFFHVISSAPTLPNAGMTGSAPRATFTGTNIADLFGKTPSLLKVAEGGLSLRGIFASATPESGSAIIAATGQKPKLYVVGDHLPNGTVLVAVHEQQVVLEKAGEQSMLSLPLSRLF